MKSRNFLALAALLATLSIASPVAATESSTNKKENSLTVTCNVNHVLSNPENSSKDTVICLAILPEPAANNWFNEKYITVLIGICGVITPIVVFVAQYRRDQEWKLREFTTKKFKEFEEAPETINVKKLLNSESKLIDLFSTATLASNRFIYVDDQMLNDALISFDNEQQELKYNNDLNQAQMRYQEKAQKNDKYPRKEEKLLIHAAIRDNFDRFAESLQLFESMIQSEAIKEKDLAPYLEPLFYTIEQAAKRTHSSNILKYLGLIGNHEQLSEVQKSIRNLRKRYPEKPPQDESNHNEKLSQKIDELYHQVVEKKGLLRFPLL
ncbi:hypothetical protein [Planktothrix mougeotii]|uniref:Uncharacterized protein n=1 Tax=Planktothrix mougeotii LEGE 06226 TaxID=1828728 RepID=A0ABR9UDG4_9CYAN|nr:hypothetical protein [Planktothrix mougeotii]MBE9144512.1 hypothetical protein [Planktothrix mougeotii LEGE 06226]